MTIGRVLLGVSGGIGAYKVAYLASRLVQDGMEVRAVLTKAAERFVGVATFAALTGHPVARELFDEAHYPLGAHIELAAAGDVLCVAPATADFLAKAAHGLADDLLSTLYLAFRGPVVMAPAMNHQMWSQPAVQRNIQQLQNDGVTIIGPEAGWLSCRDEGMGRLADPEKIRQAILQLLPGQDRCQAPSPKPP